MIVQDDDFDATRSITVCIFTSDTVEAPLFRIRVEPSELNGLHVLSSLMVDKLTTVPKERLGSRIGRLVDEDMLRLNQAMLVFLGLARPLRERG